MKFTLVVKSGDELVNNDVLALPGKDDPAHGQFMDEFYSSLLSDSAKGLFKRAIDLEVGGSIKESSVFYGDKKEDMIADGNVGQIYQIIVQNRIIPVRIVDKHGVAIEHRLDANNPYAGSVVDVELTRVE